jgi:hypothetical protein
LSRDQKSGEGEASDTFVSGFRGSGAIFPNGETSIFAGSFTCSTCGSAPAWIGAIGGKRESHFVSFTVSFFISMSGGIFHISSAERIRGVDDRSDEEVTS